MYSVFLISVALAIQSDGLHSNCEKQPFEKLVERAAKDKKRVLVTGAAGFIGSHVAEYCAKTLKYDVVSVDDMSGGYPANVPEGVTFLHIDLQDAILVDQLFQDHGPFDYVFHLAAYAAEGLSHFIRTFNYKNNVLASINLINNAINGNVSTFVFTSSIATYGQPSKLPLNEECPQVPEDPYGVAKLAVEQDLRVAYNMFGMKYVIFRPHNVFGPRQNIADKFRNAIGIFMNQALQGKPMTLFGDGTQTRGFSYITDVAPVIAISPTVPAALNNNFLLGSDGKTRLVDVAHMVAEAMGVEPKIDFLEKRLEVDHVYAEHSKARCIFNPPSPVAVKDGIKMMSEYVKTQERMDPTGYGDIEIWRNIPPSWVVALDSWAAVPLIGVAFTSDSQAYVPAMMKSIDFPVKTLVVTIGNEDPTQVKKYVESVRGVKNSMIQNVVINQLAYNPGCSAGWNWGLRKILENKDQWGIIINSDIKFSPGDLKHISETIHKQEKTPNNIGITFLNLNHEGFAAKLNWWSAFVMTRHTIQRVGTFDENFYPIYFEDDDMAIRLMLSGYKPNFITNVGLIHGDGKKGPHYGTMEEAKHDKNLKKTFDRDALLHLSHMRYLKKWGGTHNRRLTCRYMTKDCITKLRIFKHPYNDSSIPVSQWTLTDIPQMRPINLNKTRHTVAARR